MESRGAKDAYLVFCSDARAQELQATPWLKELESECHVKIEQIPGGFLIHRQGVPVQVQQQCKHLLINLIKSGAVMKTAQWFWYNGRSYSPYDHENNAIIERNFQQGMLYMILQVRGKPYQIDITRWRQVDMGSGLWRPIARNPMPQPQMHVQAPTGWCYLDRNNWRRVPEDVAQELTAASTAGQAEVQVTVHSRTYEANLKQHELRDVQSNRSYKLEFFRQA